MVQSSTVIIFILINPPKATPANQSQIHSTPWICLICGIALAYGAVNSFSNSTKRKLFFFVVDWWRELRSAQQFHWKWNWVAAPPIRLIQIQINFINSLWIQLKLVRPFHFFVGFHFISSQRKEFKVNWLVLVGLSSLCGALRLQPPLTHKSKTTKPTNQSPFMRQWPSILFSFTIQLILKELNERRKGIEWPAR